MEKNNKVMSEEETRKSFIYQALRFYGPEAARQVKLHFEKYDSILKSCKNESEKNHIKHLAITELYKMMNFYEGLVVDGKEIIPPEKTYTENDA